MIDRRLFVGGGLSLVTGLAPVQATVAPSASVWTLDNLKTIGKRDVEIIGAPALTKSPWGQAIMFDGVHDGLFIEEHPLAGAATFTFEALFRPDGGAPEQRWFHLEADQGPSISPGQSDVRMLFEIRVVESGWYLDAFMTGPGYKQAMMVPTKVYPLGRWYHVAQSYDGRTYRSYVNGELQMEVVVPFTPQGAGRTSVGVRLNRVNFFRGAVRQACFSQVALAPSRFSA